jgi:hypothetical protein
MVDASELTDPVSYSPWWALLAAVLPLLVVAWFVGVGYWARVGRTVPAAPRRRLAAVRRQHLERLDQVEAAVRANQLSVRGAHQTISAIVRSFVAEVGPVDARTMTLEQLRGAAPEAVVGIVERLYPPEFAPEEQGRPHESLVPALDDARRLVARWGP